MHDDETTKRDKKEGLTKHVQTFHLEEDDQNKNKKKFMETLQQHIKM